MAKKYLNYTEVTNVWDNIQVHWEDIFVLAGGGSSARWMRDNPWDKPWNRPEWRQMTEEQRREIMGGRPYIKKTDEK